MDAKDQTLPTLPTGASRLAWLARPGGVGVRVGGHAFEIATTPERLRELIVELGVCGSKAWPDLSWGLPEDPGELRLEGLAKNPGFDT